MSVELAITAKKNGNGNGSHAANGNGHAAETALAVEQLSEAIAGAEHDVIVRLLKIVFKDDFKRLNEDRAKRGLSALDMSTIRPRHLHNFVIPKHPGEKGIGYTPQDFDRKALDCYLWLNHIAWENRQNLMLQEARRKDLRDEYTAEIFNSAGAYSGAAFGFYLALFADGGMTALIFAIGTTLWGNSNTYKAIRKGSFQQAAKDLSHYVEPKINALRERLTLRDIWSRSGKAANENPAPRKPETPELLGPIVGSYCDHE